MSIEGQGHFLTIYVPGFVCTRPRYQVSVYRTIGPLVIRPGQNWSDTVRAPENRVGWRRILEMLYMVPLRPPRLRD